MAIHQDTEDSHSAIISPSDELVLELLRTMISDHPCTTTLILLIPRILDFC
jgi:hypothetical protein